MNESMFELYWSEIPIGKENAASYAELIVKWGKSERDVRKILHDLSAYDNGDDYILIRSAMKGGGFYRTDNADDIKQYRSECLNKGRSTFAPVKKINRVLRNNADQLTLSNNMRAMREAAGLKQTEVCFMMNEFDESFDVPMLSKMENSVCLPTPLQMLKLCEIYGCEASALIDYEMYF